MRIDWKGKFWSCGKRMLQLFCHKYSNIWFGGALPINTTTNPPHPLPIYSVFLRPVQSFPAWIYCFAQDEIFDSPQNLIIYCCFHFFAYHWWNVSINHLVLREFSISKETIIHFFTFLDNFACNFLHRIRFLEEISEKWLRFMKDDQNTTYLLLCMAGGTSDDHLERIDRERKEGASRSKTPYFRAHAQCRISDWK